MSKSYLTFFPQFCREPINDAAWYPGFTDWDLIRQVPENRRKRFIPEAGTYDLANERHIADRLQAVNRSPWPAMALYQYFFNGKFALDGVESFLLKRTIEVPSFFVIWANEDWSKRWIGKPRDFIVRQDYSSQQSIIDLHVKRLVALFRHPAYLHEDGRPTFVIYAPYDIPKVTQFVARYRESFAKQSANPRIGFCVPYLDPGFNAKAFDFCVEFQPRLFFNVMRMKRSKSITGAALYVKQRLPAVYDRLTGLRDALRRRGSEPSFEFQYSDYVDLLEKDFFINSLENQYQIPVHKGLFYSWNNFPRYRGSAVSVRHQPGDYDAFLALCKSLEGSPRWSLINSWNEWSEGAALEPGMIDQRDFESG